MAQENRLANAESNFMLFILFILMVGAMIYIYSGIFIEIWRYIRIGLFYSFSWIPSWVPVYGKLEFSEAVDFLINTPGSDLMSDTIFSIDSYLLKWVSWLPGLTLVYIGAKRFMASNGFDKIHTMESMLEVNSRIYPHLKYYVDFHPEHYDSKYVRSMTKHHGHMGHVFPYDFARMSPPMGLEEESLTNKDLQKPIWNGKNDFDYDLAERAFISQMGERFTGINSMSAIERKAFDFLVKRIKVQDVERLSVYREVVFDHLSKAKGKKLSFEGDSVQLIKDFVDENIYEYKESLSEDEVFSMKDYLSEQNLRSVLTLKNKNKDIDYMFSLFSAERIMNKHSFIRCGLMSLLMYCRFSGGTGKIPAMEFLWIKEVDRPLFFCFNQVSMDTPNTETAGPYVHYQLEVLMDEPVTHPEVIEAVEGLKNVLKIED